MLLTKPQPKCQTDVLCLYYFAVKSNHIPFNSDKQLRWNIISSSIMLHRWKTQLHWTLILLSIEPRKPGFHNMTPLKPGQVFRFTHAIRCTRKEVSGTNRRHIQIKIAQFYAKLSRRRSIHHLCRLLPNSVSGGPGSRLGLSSSSWVCYIQDMGQLRVKRQINPAGFDGETAEGF